MTRGLAVGYLPICRHGAGLRAEGERVKTMRTYDIPTEKRTSTGQVSTFLSYKGLCVCVDGKRTKYAIGGWDESAAKVADFDGEKKQGPFAYFFRTSVVMSAERGAGFESRVLSVQSGDVLLIDGESYRVAVEPTGYGFSEPVLHLVAKAN